MWALFLVFGVVFGLLAAGTAYLITYEEWSHHGLGPGALIRRSLQMAAVAFVFFVGCSLAAGWLFHLVMLPGEAAHDGHGADGVTMRRPSTAPVACSTTAEPRVTLISPIAEPAPSEVHAIRIGLHEGGCLFCRAERQDLETFWFWYFSEQYFAGHAVDRVRAVGGFCRRHTRHALRRGPRDTLATIFGWAIETATERVRALRSARTRLDTTIRGVARCLACDAEASAYSQTLRQVRLALAYADVRAALASSRGVCAAHGTKAMLDLDWVDVCRVGESVLAMLAAAEGEALPARLGLLAGSDLDAATRGHPPDPPALRDDRPAGGSWSPTLDRLHQVLDEGGCPICHARTVAARAYLDWLATELVAERPRWDDASWLCRWHTWDFARGWPTSAAERLHDILASARRQRLGGLLESLGAAPSDRLLDRLRPVAALALARARRWALSPTALLQLVRDAAERPASRLHRLRRVALRSQECPACRARQTAAFRTADLLSRSLADDETRHRYGVSSGVCIRDLPLVLAYGRNGLAWDTLLDVAEARMAVIAWELAEQGRKVNWSVRYEPRGPESDAWRRAALLLAGSAVEEGLLGAHED